MNRRTAPKMMIAARKKTLGIGRTPHTIERKISNASVAFVPV